MDLLRFRYEAMATYFEFVVAHPDRRHAQAAADAAHGDIQRIEAELSRFRRDSDPARVRLLGAGESTQIGLATFDCLSLALDVHAATRGAFDVTLAPLYEVWRAQAPAAAGVQGPGEAPGDSVQAARARTGMHQFELDEGSLTIRSRVDGLCLDFGGIGKGYALDQAACLFREWEVTAALLNAGDSTVLALDPPPDARNWLVGAGGASSEAVPLANRALSGSGFEVQGSHIIDPRSGRPVEIGRGRDQIWAAAPSAALADALSTAFIVMHEDEIDALCRAHPGEIEIFFLT